MKKHTHRLLVLSALMWGVLFSTKALSGQSLDTQQLAFLTLVNNYRIQNGAGALQVSVTLQNSSQWMSNDMATKNYFSHTDSLGRDFETRLQAFGYPYSPAGENIAAGYSDAQSTFTLWQTACDPDGSGNCTYAHRQNMLDPSYKVIGIGLAYSASSTYGWYWTTDFGAVVDQVLVLTPTFGASVNPNSGAGSTRTFSSVFSDSNGASDLLVVYLDFGTSAFLANSCIVAYEPAGNALYLFNDANTSALGPITPGGSGTVSNSQCTLSGAGGAATSAGNNLTVPFAIIFGPGFTGSKNIYGMAENYSGLNGGPQTIGTWTPDSTAPLGAVSVNPHSGAGATQTFNAVYTDPNGSSDLQVVYLDFGTSIFAANSCIVAYVQASNSLFLFNDANNGLVSGSITEGGSGSLSNSQCTLSSGGAVTPSGYNLTVPLAMTFKSGFAGSKTVYGLAQSYSGANGGWQTLGTWSPSAVALAAASVGPVNGSGLGPTTFSAVYTDPNGASDLQVIFLDFGTSSFAANSCIVAYVPAGNALYLYSNTNAATGPITPGSSATLSNSQCTLSGSGGTPSSAGNTLTVPFAITFTGGFAGSKNVYGLAQSYSGAQGGWQTLGTWTP